MPRTISFAAQLKVLEMLYAQTRTAEEKVAILSIATSVKTARDHNLNCGRIPDFDNWGRIS